MFFFSRKSAVINESTRVLFPGKTIRHSNWASSSPRRVSLREMVVPVSRERERPIGELVFVGGAKSMQTHGHVLVD